MSVDQPPTQKLFSFILGNDATSRRVPRLAPRRVSRLDASRAFASLSRLSRVSVVSLARPSVVSVVIMAAADESVDAVPVDADADADAARPDATVSATDDPPAHRLPPTNPHKKRKVALTFAYVGAGFAGMQRNPGVRTVEGELEAAIARAGGISEANAGDFGKVQWTRAARTDKGVSAVGQVVALKMVLEPPGTLERVNAALPDRFEVFGIDRVTNGFNAKTMCDRRRYEYVIPTWAFDPSVGRETASGVGGVGESAAGRFEFTESTRARVDAVLKNYCGTHNFHNYTVKVKPTDAQAKRYILSFDCSEPFEAHGETFVRCQVVGQSFMLHQIRKLIGTMLAVVRGELTEEDQKFALLTQRHAPTPMAPELGLFLCECIFGAYNDRFGSVHDKFQLDKYAEKSEKFKLEHVYAHIANQEREENTLRHWIRDTLHAKQLRAAFDASMASSIADGERLDASRVGDRRNRADKKKRPIAETVSPDVTAAFDRALREGADRFKRRKADARPSATAAGADRAPPATDAAPRDHSDASTLPRSRPPSHVPNDELSD